MAAEERRTPVAPKDAARRVARGLRDAGFDAYFAGGCVRDHLFGIEPEDYDIATSARPEEVREIFPRAFGVGAAFGVMLVPKGGRQVEVATFRSDGPYEDARHPSHVTFSSPEVDAQRRDFTINGLFQDPFSGEIIDHVEGVQDVEDRILRAIGDPAARFGEDHLRMLRAARFAARFELTIEPATASAIALGTSGLAGVSRERVGQELRRMLANQHRVAAVGIIERLGMDVAILGRSEPGERPRLQGLPADCEWVDALAAWLLDRSEGGAPDETTDQMTALLVLSNRERADLQELLGLQQVFEGGWADLGVAARKRMAAAEIFTRAVELLRTKSPDLGSRIAAEYEVMAAEGLKPAPMIGGHDLLAEGISPGPQLGVVLEKVYDAQLEGRVRTAGEALELARALIKAS